MVLMDDHMRYAVDSTKLHCELVWSPSLRFEEGIDRTVHWYLDNQAWMDNVISGDYVKNYEDVCKIDKILICR